MTQGRYKVKFPLFDAGSIRTLERWLALLFLLSSFQEDAKQRRRALEQILTEHDEIVKTIVRQSSGTFQTSSDETRHQWHF